MTNRVVQIELSEVIYLRLNVIARMRGTTVTNMFTEHGYQVAHINPEKDVVLELWGQGLADGEIAARLGWTNERAKRHRRAMELPANRRQWKNKKAMN